MIQDTGVQTTDFGAMEPRRDVRPCPPKRRRSFERLECPASLALLAGKDGSIESNDDWTNFLDETFSNIKVPNDTFQSLSPCIQASSREQPNDTKHCRFHQIFSSPLTTINDPAKSCEKSITGDSTIRGNWTNEAPTGLSRNAWSCPNNLGSTKRNKKRSFMGRKKNQSFTSLLPTITEFQRTSFDEDLGTTHPQIIQRTRARNKRLQRSASPPDQRGKSHKRFCGTCHETGDTMSSCCDVYHVDESLSEFPTIDGSIFLT
jgi:hypothetical protein